MMSTVNLKLLEQVIINDVYKYLHLKINKKNKKRYSPINLNILPYYIIPILTSTPVGTTSNPDVHRLSRPRIRNLQQVAVREEVRHYHVCHARQCQPPVEENHEVLVLQTPGDQKLLRGHPRVQVCRQPARLQPLEEIANRGRHLLFAIVRHYFLT